ncbi:unnamed protein product [Cylicocyclus nassatus]|uniref:Uncharacterized protein n=1 Tax=Cylicocyclus nassatus TaxID=53992 RepID=A0AA36GVX9_CYLNA|nr:unnamed protein product [Cylicocyclus nassatus]
MTVLTQDYKKRRNATVTTLGLTLTHLERSDSGIYYPGYFDEGRNQFTPTTYNFSIRLNVTRKAIDYWKDCRGSNASHCLPGPKNLTVGGQELSSSASGGN